MTASRTNRRRNSKAKKRQIDSDATAELKPDEASLDDDDLKPAAATLDPVEEGNPDSVDVLDQGSSSTLPESRKRPPELQTMEDYLKSQTAAKKSTPSRAPELEYQLVLKGGDLNTKAYESLGALFLA